MKNHRKVLVVGLDGATLDLIEPWAAKGMLPTLKRLMDKGASGRLRSTIPPITGPAWTSFATGTNPGKHGLYDFLGRQPGTYRLRSFNATHRRGASLWRILSEAGKKVGVLNVPLTYPPEPVNGFLITGLLTPSDAQDYCYPESTAEMLRAAVPDYVVQPAGNFDAHGREMELVRVVREMSAMRMEATRYLLSALDWDFFMVVFTATDIVQHALWHFMDSSHPRNEATAPAELRDAILGCYRQLDGYLGEILDMVDHNTYVIVMSDHGFGPLEKYIHMNTWLWREGFLRFKRTPITLAKRALFGLGFTPLNVYRLLRELGQAGNVARNVRRRRQSARDLLDRCFLSFDDIDWSQTRAYSVGNVGPIYVNLRGREPEGSVQPGQDYESALGELAGSLQQMCDPATGERLMGKVQHREEIYSGPCIEQSPDLFCLPRDWRYAAFGLIQLPSDKWLDPPFDRTGGHRMDGMLLAKGPGMRSGHRIDGAEIVDLAPTILALMGVPIPPDVDGRVLKALFTDDFTSSMKISFSEQDSAAHDGPVELSPEGERAVRERLRRLGYVS
jgi:predicted AlkP superfamily phosphohydrolase/phosphomutase